MATTLIQTNAFTDTASSSFTTGIDNTYRLYIFKWYNLRPETDNVGLLWQVNASGESGFNETMTTTVWRSYNTQTAGNNGAHGYLTGDDQGNGTSFQKIANQDHGNDADQSQSGHLFFFMPSSTTMQKQFYSRCSGMNVDDYAIDYHVGGNINITAAVTEAQFKMSSGNMNGVIKLYGIG